jgi:hypothetical protein
MELSGRVLAWLGLIPSTTSEQRNVSQENSSSSIWDLMTSELLAILLPSFHFNHVIILRINTKMSRLLFPCFKIIFQLLCLALASCQIPVMFKKKKKKLEVSH